MDFVVRSERRRAPLRLSHLTLLAACNGGGADGDAVSTTPEKSARVTSSSINTSTAVPPAIKVSALGPTEVPAGSNAAASLWTPGFKVRRLDAPSLSDAFAADACRSDGLALCTEPQWGRACGSDAKLGDVASWTLSTAGPNSVVARGGNGSCDARSEAPSGDHATVCCSRSIAVNSANKNLGFLNTTTTKLLAWETALNQRSADAVGALVDDGVAFNGKRLGKQKYAGLAGTYFRSDPGFGVVLVSCDLSIQQGDDTWTAECKTIKTLNGTPTQVTDRLIWGGVSGKIESIAEVEVAGKRTGAKDLPVESGASATGDNLDAKCRSVCPGEPVELTHCYCVCMGACTD